MTWGGRIKGALAVLSGAASASAIAAAAQPPETPPVMAVSDVALAEATALYGGPLNPWTLPEIPAFVPETVRTAATQLAADSAMPGYAGAAGLYTWAAGLTRSEGLAFLGYPYLAELSQRPEYRRVSEIYAQEATRRWIAFKGDADKIKKLEAALVTFAIRDKIKRVVELDGFFGRGQIFIDMGNDPNDTELATPLVVAAKVGVGKIKNFKVIEPFWSYPGPYEATNPLHPDFYVPSQWYVMASIVHSSRLLTVIGREMPDMLKPAYAFGGLSLSQAIQPYVNNFIRTRQSVSDLIHSFSTMIFKTDLSQVLQSGTSAGGQLGSRAGQGLRSRLDLFNRTRDNRGVFAINKETEELENVSTPLGTLDDLQAQSLEQIASIAGIPLVVLLGVTPAGLNASSDGEIKTFYATIKSYQEKTLRSPLGTIIDLIQIHEFGKIDPDITWDFVDLWEMSATEEAAIRKSDADVDHIYYVDGVVSGEEVRERITADEDSPYYGMKLVGDDDRVDESDDATDDLDDKNDPPEPEGGGKPKPAQDAAWQAEKHPRDRTGKFGSGGGSGGAAASAVNPLPAPGDVRQPAQSWEEMSSAGAAAHKEFSRKLNTVAKSLGLRTDVDLPENLPAGATGSYLFVAPNKSKARAAAKVEHDYGGNWSQLRDFVRGSIAVDSMEELRGAMSAVDAAGLKLAAVPKDKFANPTEEGYRDLNTLVRLDNGMVAELQFHLKGMITAKEAAHDLYAEQQNLTRKNASDAPNPDWSDADASSFNDLRDRQLAIYGTAWANSA